MTRISLAMTTYNGEKYLKEQLDSIYKQTLIPDEIIVVDDCSTDHTLEILEQYKEEKGLVYYINEKNIGYNQNFAKAISLCTGDYIALSDQDDIWMPEKIEKTFDLLVEIEDDKPALVSSFVVPTDEKMRIKGIRKRIVALEYLDWKYNLIKYTAQGCTIMFNKKLKLYILPIPENEIFDAYIGLTATMVGNRFYLPEALMYYRIHSHNSFAKNKISKLHVIKEVLSSKCPTLFFNGRFSILKEIEKRHKEHFVKERENLFYRLLALDDENIYRRINSMMKIKEISMMQRIKIVLLIMISKILMIK